VKFTIDPYPEIEPYFVFKIDNWDATSENPAIETTLVYDGQLLDEYAEYSMYINLILVDEENIEYTY
jgi:hypothetical protein